MYGTPFDAAASAAEVRGKDHRARLDDDVGPITAGRILANKRNEVRDEAGRQRFHGAFTGGFSAGYYNTVGSKEGWQPKSFSSSRSQHAEGAGAASAGHSIRDYMDDEDAEHIMAGTLVAKGSHDRGARDAGSKRDRDWREVEAQGGGSASGTPGAAGQPTGMLASVFGTLAPAPSARAPTIPGPLPAEFTLPAYTSPGMRILRGMGWREGKKLGENRRKGQRVGEHAKDSEQDDEAILARMWREGTARPRGFRAGLGYATASLQERQDAGTALAARAQQATAAGTKRLHMSAILERGSGLSFRPSSYAVSDGYSSGLLGGDDEGEDDAGAYRSLGMEGYDIASSKVFTGADVRRREEQRRAALGDAPGGGHRDAHANARFALTDAAAPLSLEDKKRGSTGIGTATGGEQAPRVGLDGRPPLAGFHLATRLERSFLDFSRAHAPPLPPPGWVPKPRVRSQTEPIPLYAAHGFVPPAAAFAQAQSHSSAHAGTVPSSSLPFVIPPGATHSRAAGAGTDTNAPAVQRGTDPLLAARFAKEGESEPGGALSTQPAGAGDGGAKGAATSAAIPLVGSSLARRLVPWAPARLLLKRLGLPDPLSKSDRDKAEAAADAAAAALSTASDWRAALGPSGGPQVQAVPVPLRTGYDSASYTGRSLSTSQAQSQSRSGADGYSAEGESSGLGDDAEPGLLPKPAAAIFKAIFGSDSDNED